MKLHLDGLGELRHLGSLGGGHLDGGALSRWRDVHLTAIQPISGHWWTKDVEIILKQFCYRQCYVLVKQFIWHWCWPLIFHQCWTTNMLQYMSKYIYNLQMKLECTTRFHYILLYSNLDFWFVFLRVKPVFVIQPYLSESSQSSSSSPSSWCCCRGRDWIVLGCPGWAARGAGAGWAWRVWGVGNPGLQRLKGEI